MAPQGWKQQSAGCRSRWPAKYFLAWTNPNSGWSNNEYYNIFLPQEYRITVAIDSCYYTDIHILDSKLVKNAFTRFRVPFYSFCVFNVRSTLSIIIRGCLNSRSGRTLSVDRPLFSALHLTWKENCVEIKG